MKILIITGELASSIVQGASLKTDHDIMVHVVKTPIAAFLSPKKMIHELRTLPEHELKSVDMIITPGLIRKDVSPIAREIGIPTYKGSTDAADLDIVLQMVETLDLSTKKSADKLIEEEQRRRALKYISEFEEDEKNRNKLLKKPGNILVGNLPVGEDFPMRVLAEIANAPILSHEELLKRAEYFVKSGANMVDIGMMAGENMAHKIPAMVTLLKDALDVPISIDTLQTEEIKVAVDAGVDLVLSLDHGNYQEVLPVLKDKKIPAVILPTDYKRGWVPETIEQRIDSLIDLKNKCNGIDVIADPILDPINSRSIVDSIIVCRRFTEEVEPDYCPLFFGIGNVTELLDVDSVGVNALLSGISMELGASILFTPEESGKTIGSVKELSVSSKMMFLAKMRGSIPKDLGINLLVFKDKRRGEIISEEINVPETGGLANYKFTQDPAGSFKIKLDDGRIMAVHYLKMQPTLAIRGHSAKEVYHEIIRRGLVSRIEHAAYLGQELQKAEDALKLGKNYVQDFPIFHKFMEY